MSVKSMSAIWDTSLPGTLQLLMLALADHADADGGSIYPSMDRVAWKVSRSRRQVQRLMGVLREQGYIVEVRPARRHRPAEYRINFEALPMKQPFRSGANKMPDGMREQVIEEGNRTCSICEIAGDATTGPDGLAWHVDRIVPAAAGGRYEWENVRLACATCNRSRGARSGTPAESSHSEHLGVPSEASRGATWMAPEPPGEPSGEPSLPRSPTEIAPPAGGRGTGTDGQDLGEASRLWEQVVETIESEHGPQLMLRELRPVQHEGTTITVDGRSSGWCRDRFAAVVAATAADRGVVIDFAAHQAAAAGGRRRRARPPRRRAA